ncbi:MAG: hypothetical protein JNL28_09090 [Planctomycetes bacterium]|nr:hypothetical protein [Planctomycetota bacterium]
MSPSILFALFALAACAAPGDPPEPRADWLREDQKVIKLFREAVAAKDLDVETLIARFGRPSEHEDRDIGFGVRRTKLHLYGGYTTIWVELLAERGEGDKRSRVAELRARQLGSSDRWKDVESTLKQAWGDAATAVEHGFEFTRRDEELAQSLRARTAEALGGNVAAVVPKDLARAYDLLTSPFEDVILGLNYSIDGGPPPGREEIELLASKGRYDLVRAVQRGINPEARLYASWALRELPESSSSRADASATAKLLALPGHLHTTSGCIQIWRAPKEALQFLIDNKD